MICALSLHLILAMSPHLAVPEDAYFGKSPSQVVAMGRTKWMDFYTEKSGSSSTYAMAEGMTLYGKAQQNLNNIKIVKLSKSKQKWYGNIRAKLTQFVVDSNKIGEAITGGGTIWTNINSAILADVEDLVAQSLGKTITSPVMKATVTSALQDLTKAVNTGEADIDLSKASSGHSAADCRKIISSLRAQVTNLRPLIKTAPKGLSALIDSFLIKTIVSTINAGKID